MPHLPPRPRLRRSALASLVRDQRGQGQSEFVIILVAVALVCILISVIFGNKIKALFIGADSEVSRLEGSDPYSDGSGDGVAGEGGPGDGDAGTDGGENGSSSSDGGQAPVSYNVGGGSGRIGNGGGGAGGAGGGSIQGGGSRIVVREERPDGPVIIRPGDPGTRRVEVEVGGDGVAANGAGGAGGEDQTASGVRRGQHVDSGGGEGYDSGDGSFSLRNIFMLIGLAVVVVVGAKAATSNPANAKK